MAEAPPQSLLSHLSSSPSAVQLDTTQKVTFRLGLSEHPLAFILRFFLSIRGTGQGVVEEGESGQSWQSLDGWGLGTVFRSPGNRFLSYQMNLKDVACFYFLAEERV